MVFIKAAFDNEIRKIAVESDISYSDLVQKLLQVFPSLGEQNPDNILLFYRDADGDNISFCSDTELKTALEHVGTDNTIRVLIAIKVKESTPSLGLMEDFFGDSWSDPFFQHGLGLPSLFGGFGHHLHHHPIGAFFSERQQALRDREEQLRQQRLYEEKVRKAEIERRKALMQKAKQAREERMKHLEETRRKSQELTRTPGKAPAIPDFPPGWTVRPFGSWEPVVHEGPHSTQWTWGPYGYHATYGGDMETEKQEEEEEEVKKTENQEEVKKEDQPQKSTAAAEAMESDQ